MYISFLYLMVSESKRLNTILSCTDASSKWFVVRIVECELLTIIK